MFYPVMLNLAGRRVVVVGGGGVACRKVRELLESGALVQVISPEVCIDIIKLAKDNPDRLVISKRKYAQGDLEGAALAYSATNNSDVNRTVYNEAETRNIFLNAVDDPKHCSFIVPALIRKKDLVVAVSTSGASPAMAGKLKRILEESLPHDIDHVLERMKELRTILQGDKDFSGLTSSQRGDVLKQIIHDDHLLLEILETENQLSLKSILKRLTNRSRS